MNDTVLAALIGGGASIIVGVLGVMGQKVKRIARDTQATRNQVENSHPTFLRDDLDTQFGFITRSLDRIMLEQEHIRERITELSVRVGELEKKH